MRRQVRVVRKVRKRVPISEVYAVPDTGRWLNVGLLAATPDVDVQEMKRAALKRHEDKKR